MDIKRFIKHTVFLLLLIPGIVFAGSQQTSTTLASTIITNTRMYLNDTTAPYFHSDAEMLVYLNNGTVDIVARTHCLEAIETETLVTNQMAYALTDTFIVIKAVVYNDIKALRKGSIESFGDIAGEAGEPVYWTQWGSSVLVYPIPDATANGNDIDVYTITKPDAVIAAAAITIPAYYDKALTLYIAAQALKKDAKYAQSNAVLAEYQAELDRYRVDFSYQPVKGQID